MDHRWDPVVTQPPVLVRPVPLDRSGRHGPTRGQARGDRWRRVATGLYVPADVDAGLVEQRILEQSVRLGGSGAVTGWASLRLHGARFFDGRAPDGRTQLPVPLLAGTGRISITPGCTVSRAALDPAEVVVRHGIRCTRPERALLDELRRLRREPEQVIALDMAAAGEVTSLRRMRRYLTGRRGCARFLPLLTLADEGSRSPQETRFRLIWVHDAGWPKPLCNRTVYDLQGRLLGTPDLLDVEHGIAGEYDGAEHRGRERHRQDVRREEAFRTAGLEYVEVVGADLRDPALVVARMEAARSRAGRLPRSWTVDPLGSLPPFSLDERLDLRDEALARMAAMRS